MTPLSKNNSGCGSVAHCREWGVFLGLISGDGPSHSDKKRGSHHATPFLSFLDITFYLKAQSFQ